MNAPARTLFAVATVVVAATVGAWWWLGRDRAELQRPELAAKRDAPDAATPEAVDATPMAARDAAPAGPPEPASVEMPASYRKALGGFTGRLLEPDNTPVVGLPVSAVEFDPSDFLLESAVLLDEAHAPPALESARTQTDADGRFVLALLEPRALHLLGIDLGGPRSNFRIIDRSPIPGELVELGDIVLEPFVTFVGRVVDPDGAPLPGARVRASNLPSLIFQFGIEEIRRGCGVMVEVLEQAKAFEVPPVVWEFEKLLPIPTTYSDEEGNFRLPGVPMGLVTVVADKAGFKATTKTQASGKAKERSVGELWMGEGYVVQGVVVDGTDTPVSGIEVMVGIRADAVPVPVALLQPAGRTRGDGSFSLAGLPVGKEAYVATRASLGQPLQVHGPFKAI